MLLWHRDIFELQPSKCPTVCKGDDTSGLWTFSHPIKQASTIFHFRKVLCFTNSHIHILYVAMNLFFFSLMVSSPSGLQIWLLLTRHCYLSLYHFWLGTTVYEPYSHFLLKAVLKRNKSGQKEEKKLVQMKIWHSELVEERCEEKTEKY
jgi:hypothetical protein